MAELGIGVRVYIKFNPRLLAGKRCRTGIVVDGPVEAGTVMEDEITGEGFWYKERVWCVRRDGENQPYPAAYKESDLQPIDDDNDQTTRDEREPVEETA